MRGCQVVYSLAVKHLRFAENAILLEGIYRRYLNEFF